MEKLGPDVGGLENELYKLVCKVEEDEGHIGVQNEVKEAKNGCGVLYWARQVFKSLSRLMLANAQAKIDVYGDFKNYLSPEYESQDIISLSPSESVEIKEDFSMTLCDPDKE
ncbi:hypothetical protein Tco_0211241 [Tanacetum coccineum]